MFINGEILVSGIDKDFFQEKFEFFHNNYAKIACVISYYPIQSNYNISNVDRIDLSCLYNLKLIKNAYNINFKTVIDSKFLHEMRECQSVFFSTIDRCCASTLPIENHKNYFYELLYFFKSFFENRIDIKNIFFSTTPHFPTEIVLFYVAKFLNLNIIILCRTDFNNQFFFRNDWRTIHFFDDDILFNDKKFNFNIDNDSKFVEYGKKLNKLSINNVLNNKLSRNIFYRYFYLIRFSFHVFKNKNLFSPFLLNSSVNLFSIIDLHLKRFNENIKLYYHYIKLSCKADLTANYIYFPLHFQPERSTDPEGIYFANQLVALELLSFYLPDNFKIYVKEHPRQFDPGTPDLRKLYARSIYFYNKIISLPNTFLVDINSESNQLIKNSVAVATITGSAGWEAILRGKPVFLFGKPWYSSCKSCFLINDKFDMINAINHVETSNFDKNMEHVSTFVKNIEGKTFDAFIGNVYFDGDEVTYEKLIHSFAKNLYLYISSLNK